MKQKLISFTILMVVLVMPKMAVAYDFIAVAPSGQTLYYNIVGSNAQVTYPYFSSDDYYSGYIRPTGSLTIPSNVSYGENTYYVTSIDENAFSNCNELTSVIIPNSITHIGYWAFLGCTGLTSLTVPESITNIGHGAFKGCSGLTIVYFNADSCIEAGYGENSAFSNCSNLSTFYFGDNVKSIPSYLCSGLTGITSINIPHSVTHILHGAFAGCSGLTSVTIPSSVSYIGPNAFFDCSSLVTLNFNAKSCYYAGDHMDLLNLHFYGAFYNCTNLSIVNFGDSVTAIPQYLFDGCSALTYITIPNSITFIGKAAFLDCRGLISVIIDSPVASIGMNAFAGCGNLTTAILSVDTIHEGAFKKCDHLTNITFGSGLTAIENDAFDGCTQVVRIVSKAMNPPVVQSSTFSSLSDAVILNVPCDAANAYENAAYWFRFNIQEELVYDFSATSSNPARGTVTIVTEPTCDYREAQVQANAYHGYHFDHWSDGNTDNPRYIVVLQDTHLVAYFASDNGEDEGIEETEEEGVKLYQRNGQIVVEGAEGNPVFLYDVVGRLLAARRETMQEVLLDVPSSGVYLVKIGNAPARRIVVRR